MDDGEADPVAAEDCGEGLVVGGWEANCVAVEERLGCCVEFGTC